MRCFRFGVAAILLGAAPACHGQQPATPLTNGQATKAIRDLLGIPGLQVVLGTCKPALKAKFPGQTACTLDGVSQAGTSETQADFHWSGTEWIAEPSESQTILPFPDPVLMKVHAGASVDVNAGPLSGSRSN
ncbi:hypothetical protein SAMN03159340_03606 [Sphingomonas sp. NFR15]|nr:hypothetical protein SAMN03159340_03606 [Sphingomonas sp. NFR15]